MKNLTLKILALVMTIILLLPLVIACGEESPTTPTTPSTNPPEPTEAEKFAAMNEQDKAFYILGCEVDVTSERLGGSVRLSLQNAYYQGYYIDTSVAADFVTVNTSDKYFDYSEAEITASVHQYAFGGPTVSHSATLVKTGWLDGKHFTYTEVQSGNQTSTQKIYVLRTQEEYIEEKAKTEAENQQSIDVPQNFGITKGGCATVTCTQDENGNWVATFEDANEDTLAEFKKIVKSFEQFINVDEISDIRLRLTVDADFKPLSANVVYEFSGTRKPHLVLNCKYASGYDVVEPEIDLSDYNETK